jgi:hypothetical protein
MARRSRGLGRPAALAALDVSPNRASARVPFPRELETGDFALFQPGVCPTGPLPVMSADVFGAFDQIIGKGVLG